MAAQKVCKSCKAIADGGNKCSKCGSSDLGDSFKGKAVILRPEESEIAKKINIKTKGAFAIKIR